MEDRGAGTTNARRIVIGVDFSAPSVAAARWTAHHLSDGEEIVLAHAICIPEPPRFLAGLHQPVAPLVEAARRGAEMQLRELGASLGVARVWPEIHVGRPDEVIASVSRAHEAELIVIGPHGERAGIGKWLGSTAERVASEGPASVLLARRLPDGPFRTIVVSLEESPVGQHLLAWTKRLAARTGAEAVALHVVNPLYAGAVASGATSAERRRAEEQLRARAEEWVRGELQKHGLEAAATEVTLGDAGFEILAAFERHSADLVVLGRSTPGRGRSRGIGGTASFVLRSGAGSVLLVAPPEED